MSSSIKVVCRIRPKINKETYKAEIKIVFQNQNEIRIQRSEDKREYKFGFDRIFYPGTSQEEVYEYSAKPVIESVLQGFNGTIIAYGQTSSGKTFTMIGGEDLETQGIIPRMVDTVFQNIEDSDENIEYIIKASVVEIYNEKIRDLLDNNKINLRLRETGKKGFYIQNLTEIYVTNEQDIMSLLYLGIENRSQASTEMNEGSSRSHMMFVMEIKQTDVDQSSRFGKLILVDLAGSESFDKAQTQGQQLEETKNINQSLFALKNVIKAITSKNKFVPYRDSKLTRLCMDSLGGNSKTTVIINASPSIYNESETISSLRFGEIARQIKNTPVINIEQTVDQLKALLLKMEQELEQYKKKVGYYEQLLNNNRVKYEDQDYEADSPVKVIDDQEVKQNIEIDQELIHKYQQQIHNFEEELDRKNQNIRMYNSKYVATKNKCLNQINELNLLQKQNKSMIERQALLTITMQELQQGLKQQGIQIMNIKEQRDSFEKEKEKMKEKYKKLDENKYQLEKFLDELSSSIKEKDRQRQQLGVQIRNELQASEQQRQFNITNDNYVSLDHQYQELKQKYERVLMNKIDNYQQYKQEIVAHIHNDYCQYLLQHQNKEHEENRKTIIEKLQKRVDILDKIHDEYEEQNKQRGKLIGENQKQQSQMQKIQDQLELNQQLKKNMMTAQEVYYFQICQAIEEKYIEKEEKVKSLEQQLQQLQIVFQEQQNKNEMLENELKFIYNNNLQLIQNEQSMNTPIRNRVSVASNSYKKFYQSDANDVKHIGESNMRRSKIVSNFKIGRRNMMFSNTQFSNTPFSNTAFSNNPSSVLARSIGKHFDNQMILEEN